MKTDYKYIRFVEIPNESRKTNLYDCYSHTGDVLGFVHWYGPWRQYCFQPRAHIVFSVGCLADVGDFITQLMEERRKP